MLLTNARAFFLDEVSTGLDAAVTLHIFSALKQWCAINNSSVVVALLQPTPETYALFDNVSYDIGVMIRVCGAGGSFTCLHLSVLCCSIFLLCVCLPNSR